jgi:hypothetical protein
MQRRRSAYHGCQQHITVVEISGKKRPLVGRVNTTHVIATSCRQLSMDFVAIGNFFDS